MAAHPGFSIRQETLARRCEICHQSDSFIPETNHCSRCDGVPTAPEPSPAAVIPVETPMFLRSYADPDQQAYEIFSERFVMAAVTPYMLFTLGIISREVRFPDEVVGLLIILAAALFFILPLIGMATLIDLYKKGKSIRTLFLGTLIASGPMIWVLLSVFLSDFFGMGGTGTQTINCAGG
ncbi:MAG TPA: hypothetical protein PKZ53_13645 [Acidobacteriota bacterium]|nr:hypothetical protein [Acidobacteriota bacterium]HNJ41531.1 hypothetical protein [Acidobacteriota bacterium]